MHQRVLAAEGGRSWARATGRCRSQLWVRRPRALRAAVRGVGVRARRLNQMAVRLETARPTSVRGHSGTLAQASSLGRGIDSIRCRRSVGQGTTRFPDARSASFIHFVVDRDDGVACVGTPQDEPGCSQQSRGGRSLALSPCGDYETRREAHLPTGPLSSLPVAT